VSISVTIPKAAPFTDEEIELLNRVVGVATTTQRSWLAGFLAGLETTAVPEPAAVAPSSGGEPLTIVYATESGNSEKLAADLGKAARKAGLKSSIIDMADLDVATLASARRLIMIAATWGEGEPPGRAARAYNELMGEGAPRLDGIEFGVLALGDTAYAAFCAAGRTIDERLAALGGKRVIDRVDCDLDFAKPAAAWIERAITAFAPADSARGAMITPAAGAMPVIAAAAGPMEAEITEHINLNSSRSIKETIHLELAFDGAAPPYKPGDSLDIYPKNDPAYVDALLQSAGVVSDDGLRDELIASRDVTTLSPKTLETYAASTGYPDARSLIESGEGKNWIAGRQLIDLVDRFPIVLSSEQLRALTRPLAPRAYSIASSRCEAGEEAHLLISTVRYETHGRARKGVASTFVAERLRKGCRLQVKVKPNKHFGLPSPDRDIIMIGPGTGVAPFRAFVQERRATGASGRSWLFFGDRSFTHDFLYQLEWQDALADKSLTRMDVAFSRDQPEKVYVQHRLWEYRRDVVDWLDNGAFLYVCGDAKTMAKDVRRALVHAYADVKGLAPEAAEGEVAGLERGKRYLQDVY
jgi:sulfite reductase (NADPH) flavoprotein alpha-component